MPLRAACAGGKTVQLSKGRGSERRNWKGGWMGGKKPAHGSRRMVKGREVATVSPLFTGSSGKLLRTYRSNKFFSVHFAIFFAIRKKYRQFLQSAKNIANIRDCNRFFLLVFAIIFAVFFALCEK